jgi:hypothetical protein
VVREVQETVEQLRTDLKDTRTQLEELRAAHEGLARAVLNKPPAPSYLGVHLGLSFGVLIALGLGVAGWFAPPEPERIMIPVQVDGAQTAATPIDPAVEPTDLGVVEMLGGTISLEGERGVFGAGMVPPGTYKATARPQRGPDQNLGEITVYAGEQLSFQCAAGVCARIQE